MYPYSGVSGLFISGFILAIILCGVSLFMALSIEKKSKGKDGSPKGNKQYLAFAGFVVFAGVAIAVGFSMSSLSMENHHEKMVKEIQSHGVTIKEGFVDPHNPLKADSIAKFVIETDSSINRCRAIATNKDTKVTYMCQDAEREFTIPLSVISEAGKISKSE